MPNCQLSILSTLQVPVALSADTIILFSEKIMLTFHSCQSSVRQTIYIMKISIAALFSPTKYSFTLISNYLQWKESEWNCAGVYIPINKAKVTQILSVDLLPKNLNETLHTIFWANKGNITDLLSAQFVLPCFRQIQQTNLMIFFLILPESRIWHFMQTVS